MNRRQILVIEDDAAIRRGVVDALRYAGYDVLEAGDGADGAELAVGAQCDLLLLDLVLPGRDGLEVLKEVQRNRPELPVIILTARGEEADRIRGLRHGADDYVVKPFSVRELLARVEAVLRRSPGRTTPSHRIRFEGGIADLTAGELRFDDGRCDRLSERETQLLRYLAAQNGRIVSRQELLARVWAVDPTGIETRSVDMQIARLREKLGDQSDLPRILLTIRGKGYKLMTGVSA